MAQLFRRYALTGIGTAEADMPDGSDFPTGFHALVGVHVTNTSANMVLADVYISTNSSSSASGSAKYYLLKSAPIASGGAIQVLDGGAKTVVQAGDRLWIKLDSGTADAWVSVVQEISL
jgi:hypothetical protein|tara:strand:- start:119 stop:475 length:357 start_codon:yes stop_codon:yes gene_type:complete